MEGLATSPVPKKVEAVDYLTFYDALREVANGKKITRREWPQNEYGFLGIDGFLSIHRQKDHHWLVNDGDMLAIDWIVLE